MERRRNIDALNDLLAMQKDSGGKLDSMAVAMGSQDTSSKDYQTRSLAKQDDIISLLKSIDQKLDPGLKDQVVTKLL